MAGVLVPVVTDHAENHEVLSLRGGVHYHCPFCNHLAPILHQPAPILHPEPHHELHLSLPLLHLSQPQLAPILHPKPHHELHLSLPLFGSKWQGSHQGMAGSSTNLAGTLMPSPSWPAFLRADSTALASFCVTGISMGALPTLITPPSARPGVCSIATSTLPQGGNSSHKGMIK